MAGSLRGRWTSLIAGFRMPDAGDLADLANQFCASKTGLIGLPGGGQAGATQLSGGMNSLDVVATAGDSFQLPPAQNGSRVYVRNNTGQSAQVFAQAGEQICPSRTLLPTASNVGVSQASAVVAVYVCFTPGIWAQGLLG